MSANGFDQYYAPDNTIERMDSRGFVPSSRTQQNPMSLEFSIGSVLALRGDVHLQYFNQMW